MKAVKQYYVSEMSKVLPRVSKNGVAYFLQLKGIEPVTVHKGLRRTTRLYSQEAFDAAVEIGKQMEQEVADRRAQKEAKAAAKPVKTAPSEIAAVLEATAALDRRVEFLQVCLLAVMTELNIKVPE